MTDQPKPDRCILIAEDEPLIAFYLEDLVDRAGFSVAGSFVSCEAAETWLSGAERRLDGAILDVLLRDGPCFDLVRRLKAAAVPIVLVSAAVGLPAEFASLPLLAKPIDPDELVRWLDGLIPGPGAA